jgi:hypothetical protein
LKTAKTRKENKKTRKKKKKRKIKNLIPVSEITLQRCTQLLQNAFKERPFELATAFFEEGSQFSRHQLYKRQQRFKKIIQMFPFLFGIRSSLKVLAKEVHTLRFFIHLRESQFKLLNVFEFLVQHSFDFGPGVRLPWPPRDFWPFIHQLKPLCWDFSFLQIGFRFLFFFFSVLWSTSKGSSKRNEKMYEVIIAGGGVVGCVLAHTLIQKGITNIVVLERAKLVKKQKNQNHFGFLSFLLSSSSFSLMRTSSIANDWWCWILSEYWKSWFALPWNFCRTFGRSAARDDALDLGRHLPRLRLCPRPPQSSNSNTFFFFFFFFFFASFVLMKLFDGRFSWTSPLSREHTCEMILLTF